MNYSERLEVQKVIFKDYCNNRERIQRMSGVPLVHLNKTQEQQVLAIARKSYRQREWTNTANWFANLWRETDEYLTTLKMKDWPSMRGR